MTACIDGLLIRWFCVVMRYYHHIAVLFLRVLYDIAEILQNFVLNTNQSINQSKRSISFSAKHTLRGKIGCLKELG